VYWHGARQARCGTTGEYRATIISLRLFFLDPKRSRSLNRLLLRPSRNCTIRPSDKAHRVNFAMTLRRSDHSPYRLYPMHSVLQNEANSGAHSLCNQGCYDPDSSLQAIKYSVHCKCIRTVSRGVQTFPLQFPLGLTLFVEYQARTRKVCHYHSRLDGRSSAARPIYLFGDGCDCNELSYTRSKDIYDRV
jgi:hypothetical protein